jgi:hypothetical protein
MRVKLKHVSKEIKLTLSARQKQQIQRVLGYRFEAEITKNGLLLHTSKQKYRLTDFVDEPISDEMKAWMNTQPVGKEII